jgi:phosphatidylglycerol:prolipoprotein diacylglycerol transferase
MLTTLFHIPARISWGSVSLPLFGVGILLAAVVGAGAVLMGVIGSRHGWRGAVAMLGGPLLMAAALVGVVLPALDDGQGVPIRGYGVMLLLAATAGIWLSIARGRRMGFDTDTILALGMEIFLAGIVGARIFYVIEYHETFFPPGRPWRDGLLDALNIPAGGLVVFGSLPAAGLAAWWFAKRRGLPLLRLADCVVPGMLVGLALGRIGCFLNGCCYGGPCELPWAVQFPPESPPWIDQVQRNLLPPAADGDVPWSLPVHPTQLYAAIDAALLAWLAVAATPFARRHGEIFALVLTLHPVSRILLEEIRVDEPPALGTPLSISQVISVGLLLLATLLWWWIARHGRICSSEAPS